MKLLDNIIKSLLTKRLTQIDFFKQKPLEVQERIFTKLIQKAQNTEWGKKYDYKRIRNPEDYRQRVPISSYEDIFPYIQRMLRGEQNVLWGSKVTWFSKSSGTTNARSKFIPVSWESLRECHFRGGKDVLALYLANNAKESFFLGKRTLNRRDSFETNPEYPQSSFGDISAVVVQNLPTWAQALKNPTS